MMINFFCSCNAFENVIFVGQVPRSAFDFDANNRFQRRPTNSSEILSSKYTRHFIDWKKKTNIHVIFDIKEASTTWLLIIFPLLTLVPTIIIDKF